MTTTAAFTVIERAIERPYIDLLIALSFDLTSTLEKILERLQVDPSWGKLNSFLPPLAKSIWSMWFSHFEIHFWKGHSVTTTAAFTMIERAIERAYIGLLIALSFDLTSILKKISERPQVAPYWGKFNSFFASLKQAYMAHVIFSLWNPFWKRP